jgi:predicted MPP superfamily phosphohydrolase
MSNQLQMLPPSMVVASFLINSVVAGVFWLQPEQTSPAVIAGLGVLTASMFNWSFLRRLPKEGRSFGPDQPPALALSAVQALAVMLVGVFGLPIGVALGVVALISVVAYYATWIEPFALGLTRQRLTAKEWRGGAPGEVCLRVMHVSDLHVERTTERERRMNMLIASMQPDIIVFTGDFVNLSYTDDQQAKKDIRAIIGDWKAPLGVYCVPGTPTVEPMPRVLEFVEGLPNLKLLANRWVKVETRCGDLHILGMITTHDLKTDRDALAKQMATAPEGGFKLLLVHSPDLAPEAASAGIDLYLCGHTHGGQLRLPLYGALATASHLGKRFEMGRYEVGQMTLYTSRGVGMEGLGAPRARLLCPPEVILWEVVSSS